jgi:hypothetical protein
LLLPDDEHPEHAAFKQREYQLGDEALEAFWDLHNTVPTTKAGAAELVSLMQDVGRYPDDDLVQAGFKSLALFLRGAA